MAAYLSQRNVLEDNINLENLRKLKSAFQNADANAGGSLDVEEFVHAFKNSLNLRNLDYTEDNLRALFQKVRARAALVSVTMCVPARVPRARPLAAVYRHLTPPP